MGRKAVPKEKIEELAKLSAIGKSCKEISNEVHLEKSTIAKKLKDVDAKKILESFQKYYLTYAQDVKRGFMELVLSKDPAVRQKAISEYHSILGISPSHTPSIFINNLYQNNRQQIVAPEVTKLLGKHLKDNIMDVTPLKIESKGKDNKDE